MHSRSFIPLTQFQFHCIHYVPIILLRPPHIERNTVFSLISLHWPRSSGPKLDDEQITHVCNMGFRHRSRFSFFSHCYCCFCMKANFITAMTTLMFQMNCWVSNVHNFKFDRVHHKELATQNRSHSTHRIEPKEQKQLNYANLTSVSIQIRPIKMLMYTIIFVVILLKLEFPSTQPAIFR